jgi:cyanate lyase
MAERAAAPVDGALQRDAVERLLEWGFTYEEIANNLGRSEAWVRAVHEAGRADQSDTSHQQRASSSPD